MEEKYLIWHVQGGLGKHIMATSLCQDIKAKYSDRKFILVCAYPELFLNMPYIDRVYNLTELDYFYEEYIEDKDTIIFKHDPYDTTNHILGTNHVIESWCEILNISYKNQKPIFYPNYSQNFLKNKWERNKPILILQTNGGPPNQDTYCWTRDIPIELATAIVQKYSPTYHIIHVTRPGGYTLPVSERLEEALPNTELFALLSNSSKRILIDSVLQHASVALNLPSSVIWIGTNPKVFGYDVHKNIKSKPPKIANQLSKSYLNKYMFYNNHHECPYINFNEMFNIKEVLDKLGN